MMSQQEEKSVAASTEEGLRFIQLTPQESTVLGDALRGARAFFALERERRDAADYKVSENGTDNLYVSHHGVFYKNILDFKTPTETHCEHVLVMARTALLAAAKRWLATQAAEPLLSRLLGTVDEGSQLIATRWASAGVVLRQIDPSLVTLVVAGDITLNSDGGDDDDVDDGGPNPLDTHRLADDAPTTMAVMIGSMLARISNGFVAATPYGLGSTGAGSVTLLLRLMPTGSVYLPGEQADLDTDAFYEDFTP